MCACYCAVFAASAHSFSLAPGVFSAICAPVSSGNMRMAVALPEGEDLNEWLAVNSTLRLLGCGRVGRMGLT